MFLCIMRIVNQTCTCIAVGTQGEVDTSEDRRREIIRQRLKEKEVRDSTCTVYMHMYMYAHVPYALPALVYTVCVHACTCVCSDT